MTVLGIPLGRLAVYAGAVALLVGLNVARFTWRDSGPVAPVSHGTAGLSELPSLAVASDFVEVPGQPLRNLFRADAPAPPPPPEPAPEAQPEPAPDPGVQIRSAAESALDSISVIGFLSTGDGIVAVLNMDGSIVNAFKGDRPAPGFLVSDVTIDSVTLTHVELGLKRTYGLEDAD